MFVNQAINQNDESLLFNIFNIYHPCKYISIYQIINLKLHKIHFDISIYILTQLIN